MTPACPCSCRELCYLWLLLRVQGRVAWLFKTTRWMGDTARTSSVIHTAFQGRRHGPVSQVGNVKSEGSAAWTRAARLLHS